MQPTTRTICSTTSPSMQVMLSKFLHASMKRCTGSTKGKLPASGQFVVVVDSNAINSSAACLHVSSWLVHPSGGENGKRRSFLDSIWIFCGLIAILCQKSFFAPTSFNSPSYVWKMSVVMVGWCKLHMSGSLSTLGGMEPIKSLRRKMPLKIVVATNVYPSSFPRVCKASRELPC